VPLLEKGLPESKKGVPLPQKSLPEPKKGVPAPDYRMPFPHAACLPANKRASPHGREHTRTGHFR
jgi:hypothetical protein